MLEQCGNHFQADRATLHMRFSDNRHPDYAYEWCSPGIAPVSECKSLLDILEQPGVRQHIDENGWLHISGSQYPPAVSMALDGYLRDKNITSVIIMKLAGIDDATGYLSFEAVQTSRKWDRDHREIIQVLGKLLSDALRQVKSEKEINYLAYYDALTGLPNRLLLTDRLRQAISLAARTEKLISVLFIDIDSFKAVNDTMGHDGGDEMLIQIAKRLTASVREYDTVARFGGDEFLVIMPLLNSVNDIEASAHKIMSLFDRPIAIKGQEFFTSASTGIAVFPFDGDNPDELIKNADMAMYEAKSKGKNRFAFCTAEMKKEVLENMELTNSLYRAIEKNELFLEYQPQINPETMQIIGLEALLRWRHPVHGIIPPMRFITLAEKTSLIHSIGEWVLLAACRQNILWQNQGLKPVKISVNLSVQQFYNPHIIDIISGVLARTGVEPKCLELEVTESVGSQDADYVFATMNRLKSLGVSLSIDDFGTDYSSLGRLKNLPVDRIKIDMQFVRGIGQNLKDEGIIKVILELGRTLGLKVVAEGVETAQQLAFLKENACTEIQGYYFYKPMAAQDVAAILPKS